MDNHKRIISFTVSESKYLEYVKILKRARTKPATDLCKHISQVIEKDNIEQKSIKKNEEHSSNYCCECKGKGYISVIDQQAWDREFERLDNIGSFNLEECRKKAEETSYIKVPCPSCCSKI